MKEPVKIHNWENVFSEIKRKLFYFLSIIIVLGNTVDLIAFGEGNLLRTVYTNSSNIFLVIIIIVLFYFKKIKIQPANGLLLYILIFNILISLFLGINVEYFDKFILREIFILATIVPFMGFLLGKRHVIYFGVIVSIFYSVMMAKTKNVFLIDNIPLILIVFSSYIGWIYYIMYLIESGYNKQIKLINILEIKNIKLDFQKEELHNLNKIKDKILSIIGHDLKNPFTSIIISSDILLDEFKEDCSKNAKKIIKSINDSAHQASKLLDNLLQWSRLHNYKIKPQPKIFNMNNLIEQNIAFYANSILGKKLNVSYNDLDIDVYADERMIDTVLRNLLSNAIKFSKKSGKIIINIKKDENNLTCSISDNGVGIQPDKQSALFNFNIHFSNKGTNNERGTGLGLILCYDFIKHHNGKIWVESELGKGSTFYFTIPLQYKN